MKEVWVLILQFLMFFKLFPRILLGLDPRGRLGEVGGKAGSACEEFEDSEVGMFS